MDQRLPALLTCLLLGLFLQVRAAPLGPQQKVLSVLEEECRRLTGVCGRNTIRVLPRPGRRSDPLFSPRPQRAIGMLKMPRIGRSDLLVSALARRPTYDADASYDFLGDNLAYYYPAERDDYARPELDYFPASESRFHYADQPITDNVNSRLEYKARVGGAERE